MLENGLDKLAQWLARKVNLCAVRKAEALIALEDCGVHLTVLRAEWEAQRAAQTTPSPRMLFIIFQTDWLIHTRAPGRSKQAAQKAIEALLNARQSRNILQRRIKKLEDEFAAQRGTPELQTDLERYEAQLEEVMAKIQDKEAQLGRVSNRALSLARNYGFFERRMAARVIKGRLRARLIQRKMEFARIERPLRTQANGE